MTLFWSDALHRFDNEAQVRWSCAATAADDICAEVISEMDQLGREAFRRLVVVHLAFNHRRQACVGKNRTRKRGVLANVANALRHVLRTSSAIHSDNIDRKWSKRSQSSGDLSAVEHRAKHFDRDLRDDRYTTPCLFELSKDCGECGLCLQEILAGFDYQ